MIYKVSCYLTLLLQKEELIQENQAELYEYGFQITIANVINFGMAFLIGIVFHSLIEVALFYCVFVSLRFYCGGYHADSYGKCFVLFAMTNILCLYASWVLSGLENTVVILFPVTVLWLAWCIWKKAPVEHCNRPLNPTEKSLFKKRAVQVYCFWVGVGTVLCFFGIIWMVAGLINTFIAVSILMFSRGGNKDGKEDT